MSYKGRYESSVLRALKVSCCNRLPRTGLIFYAKAPGMVDTIGESITPVTKINWVKNSHNLGAGTWSKSADITFDSGTKLVTKSTTAVGSRFRITPTATTIAVGKTACRIVIRAKSGTLNHLWVQGLEGTTLQSRGTSALTLSSEYKYYSVLVTGINPLYGINVYIYIGETNVSTDVGDLYIDSIHVQDYSTPAETPFLSPIVTGAAEVSEEKSYDISTPWTNAVVVGDSLYDSATFVGFCNGHGTYLDLTESAVGGTGTGTILSTFAANISGKSAVLIGGGTNDIIGAVADPSDDIRTNILAMIALADGLDIILSTVPPFGGSEFWNADRQGWAESHNTWIKSLGYPVLDLYAILVGDDDITIDAALNLDFVHPNTLGRWYMAIGLLSITDLTRTYLGNHSLIEVSEGVYKWPASPIFQNRYDINNAIYNADGTSKTFATPALALTALETLADDTNLFVGPKGAALYNVDMSAKADKINRYLGS